VRHVADPGKVADEQRSAAKERTEQFANLQIDPSQLTACSPGVANTTWDLALSGQQNPVTRTFLCGEAQLHGDGTAVTMMRSLLASQQCTPCCKGLANS
jgi:hypothetical protein